MERSNSEMVSTKIISLENVDGREVLNFDKIALQELLRPVKDLPVCVITVTSKEDCRLVTFLLKKFLKNEMPNIWNEKTIPPMPKVEKSEKQCGIWIHGQPLVVNTNDDSETIAVILLEAVGNFDQKMEDSWKKVVGLSMYISSQLIMCCSNFIQEHVLNDIKFNLPNEDKVGLRQLIFLVQEWSNTAQHSIGHTGGSEFLAAKLKEKNGEATRMAIKMSFEAIQCFLMPKAPLFRNGDNDTYLTHAESFFSKYFSPNNLIVKSYFGKELKGFHLLDYLEMYTAVLTGDSKGSLAKSTIKQFKQMQIKEVCDFYRKNMRKSLQVADITKEDEEKAHNQWKDKAIALTQATSYGHESIVNEIVESLQDNIAEEFEALKIECHSRRVNNLIERATESFRKAMNEKFPGLESKIPTETEDIKSSSYAANIIVMAQLEEPIKLLGIHPDVVTEALAKEEALYVMKNETIKVEQALTLEMDEIYLDCCNDQLPSDSFENLEQVEEYLSSNKDYAMEKLIESTRALTVNGLSDENVPSKYKQILQEKFDDYAKEVTDSWKKENLENITKTAQNSLKIVFMQYEENMKAIQEPLTEGKIVNTYEKYSQEARDQFHAMCDQMPEEIMEEFVSHLNSKTIAVKTEVLESFKQRMKIIEDTFNNAHQNSLSFFKNKLLTFSSQKNFHDDDVIQSQSDLFKKKAIQVFIDFPKINHSEETNARFLTKLNTDIDSYSNEIVTKNWETRKKILDSITHHQERCQKMFDDDFKKSYKSARDEETLQRHYEEAMTKALEDFRNKNQHIDEETWADNLNELETNYAKTYQDTLEFCQLKWHRQDRITNDALVGAREFYHEQMKKHQSSRRFFNPAELEKLHKKTMRMAIAKAAESVTLNDEQKEDLQKYLDISFKIYNDQNLMNLPQDPVIGIDLGTTYSCVSLYYKGETVVIRNKNGQKTTPSYVSFRNGIATVGHSAKKLAYANPDSTIFDAKRLIGRKFNDEDVQNDIKHWPFSVIEENENPKIKIGPNSYYPEQISSKILMEMKTIAEDFIGVPGSVKKCVITVPARFNDSQRVATKDAGEMAGLEVLRIINEPTAAAIAYKVGYSDSLKRNILIFDLGGGTFDVAVLEMKKGEINVKATDGNAHLGGEDFDNRVSDYCAREYERIKKKPLFPDRNSVDLNQRWNYQSTKRLLRDACEESKICLSTDTEVHVVERNHDLDVVLTRRKFEELNEDLFEECIEIVEKALKNAKLDRTAIDDIVLVGGSTRIPKIQKMLSDFFGGRALNHRVHPDEAVAIGAAIQGAIDNGEILKGTLNYNELSDVTPFSIGIEVLGGGMSVVIPRNTAITIPKLSVDHDYFTVNDNQTSVCIKVFQGEKIVAVDNVPLGEFILDGIPPAPRGTEKIVVKMEIDIEGVLNVTATCFSNGIAKTGLSVTEQKWRLTRETIQRILSESSRG